MFLYVIRLGFGKYYVGKTNDLAKRIVQHRDGKGAKWTKKFPFLRVEHWFYGEDSQEDLLTLYAMRKFGISNVRGGRWTKIELGGSERAMAELKISQLEKSSFPNTCMSCMCMSSGSGFCSLHAAG